MKRQVIGEGAWVFFGQGASALGVLVGVRLLTEFLAPDTFGELALVVGIAALAVGLVGNPLMQAVLRYYPDSIKTGDVVDLRASVTIYLVKATFVFSAIWLGGWWVYSQITSAAQWYGLLVVALLAVDLARSLEVAFFNAARRQRSMALTTIADSWGRPMAAVAAITLIGATVTLVVVSYVIASLVLLAILFSAAKREGVSRVRSTGERGTTYNKEVLRYALPLVPLGLIGWVCNLSDRYVLAGVSGLEQAGLYAAMFAVASRPAWLLGGAVETTLRPIYFHAVTNNNSGQQVRVFRTWLILQFVMAMFLTAVFWLFSGEISFWLLGERYRSASSLMPWIALGSGLVVVAQVFTGLCYANRNTTKVLRIEIVGAIARVIVGYPAIYATGLKGAAFAVPIASAVQLAAAVALARNYVPTETCRDECTSVRSRQ